ncbi:hypothetical protein QTP88_011855 [Uroleucon formosanum]
MLILSLAVKRDKNRLGNNCSSSSASYNDAEKRFKDKSDSTVQTLQTVQTKIVDSKFEKNDSSNSVINNNDEKLSKDKSDSTVQKDNVDSKSENFQQVIEHNIDENSEEISWLLCAGQMEDLVSNFNEGNTLLSKLKEDTLPNPIMFMLESQQVINRIKLKSEYPSDHIQSVSKPKYFVEHDPGQGRRDIDPSKQKSFNPIWLKEYPMLVYILITDSAYCFVCSFPKGLGRQFSNEAWVKQGVNTWQKMKSREKAKLGKLE